MREPKWNRTIQWTNPQETPLGRSEAVQGTYDAMAKIQARDLGPEVAALVKKSSRLRRVGNFILPQLAYGAGSYAGEKLASTAGASEELSGALGGVAGMGAMLGTAKALTRTFAGTLGGKVGVGLAGGLAAMQFIPLLFGDKKQEETKLSDYPEGSFDEINLKSKAITDDLTKKTQMFFKNKSPLTDAVKGMTSSALDDLSGINAIASQYRSLTDPSGISHPRVQDKINEFKTKASDATGMITTGALLLAMGNQGGADMIKTGQLLNSEMFAKSRSLLSAADVLHNGSRAEKQAASAYLHKELDDLEGMGIANKDALTAVGMGLDYKMKMEELANRKLMQEQELGFKIMTSEATGGQGKLSQGSINNAIKEINNVLESKKRSLYNKATADPALYQDKKFQAELNAVQSEMEKNNRLLYASIGIEQPKQAETTGNLNKFF